MTNQLSILGYNLHLFEGSLAGDAWKAKNWSEEAWGKVTGRKRNDPHPLIYQDRERCDEVVSRIRDEGYGIDIVALSEVWGNSVADNITKSLQSDFQFYRYSGSSLRDRIKGSCGLLLGVRGARTTKFSFKRYQNLIKADAFSEKGVAILTFDAYGKKVTIIQTHAQATYADSEVESYKSRQKDFLEVLYPIIQECSREHGPVFLIGDLNIGGESGEYRNFSDQMAKFGMADSWTIAYHDGSSGITYDPHRNALIKLFDPNESVPQRLDYIFFRKEFSKIKHIKIPLDWKTKSGTHCSDHYPLKVTFSLL
jgi:endonuclease/exonuclease/phosphatase family metal-dependent hydrolase